jgi:hypothetical protein
MPHEFRIDADSSHEIVAPTDHKMTTTVREIRAIAHRETNAAAKVEIPRMVFLSLCRGTWSQKNRYQKKDTCHESPPDCNGHFSRTETQELTVEVPRLGQLSVFGLG